MVIFAQVEGLYFSTQRKFNGFVTPLLMCFLS